MDTRFNRDQYRILEAFVSSSLEEQAPDLKGNTRLLVTIMADCMGIFHPEAGIPIHAFTCYPENERRDVVTEFHFEEIDLTPNSPLLSVFSHASNVQVQTGKSEDDGADVIMITATYKDVFSN